MTKRILVTGGAGFLGSHLCRYLLEKNHEVICVDNFFTGDKKNIQDMIGNKNFELLRHDIVFPLFVEVDQVFNLACPAAPIHYQMNKIKTIKTNTVGMINMLGLAKRCNARILQASTSEIYGDPLEHPQKESYWGNVNTLGPRSCFSDDTEILTKAGWKLIKNIASNDEILTLGENDYIEYQKPIEIIKQRYVGELISFKNYQCDLSVTPNHNMYVRKRDDKKRSTFQLLPAFETLTWERAHMLKTAKYQAKDKEWFFFPDLKLRNAKVKHIEKIKMDDWLEFFGYYISEGCVYNRKRTRKVDDKLYHVNDYYILIAQSKSENKRNYDKIRECLSRLPFNFGDFNDHQLCICNMQLCKYLEQFGKSREKFIPRELLDLSQRQLRILFDAMMLGDGNKKGDTYYTNSYKLASDFQEILLKLEYAGNIFVHDKRKKSALYNIHILNRFNRRFTNPTYPMRSIVKYDGYVYCVNIPNHIIFIRRNGKALFCGNCYDEGKRVAEALMMAYHWQNNVDIRIARIFNTYGPNMTTNDGRVISNFIIQALKNDPITIYGNGSQTRSFCYVIDLIEGLYRLMNAEEFIGPINLGNPNEMTILEIAKKIKELTNSRSEIIFEPLPKDDPTRRKPDITLATTKLGWAPKVSFEEGLRKTVEYFQNELKNSNMDNC